MKQATNNNAIVKVGQLLFGTTCHHNVIEFEVTTVKSVNDGEFYDVQTQLLKGATGYPEIHHRVHFKSLFIVDGEFDKSSVFTCKGEAIQYAIKNLAREEENIKTKLSRLMSQKATLIEQQSTEELTGVSIS